VSGDERLRLFLALRLPDDVLDEVERWQREHLRDVRAVRREHLHITLAFLGRRPSGELESIVGALREAAAGAGPMRLMLSRYRETRGIGMLVLEDGGGHATLLAEDVQERLEASACTDERVGHGCRISRSPAGALGRGSSSSRRRWERLFRPTLLLTYPGCTQPGRSTKSWNLSL
jgi:LigT like Phosphoesterase